MYVLIKFLKLNPVLATDSVQVLCLALLESKNDMSLISLMGYPVYMSNFDGGEAEIDRGYSVLAFIVKLDGLFS